MTETPRVNRVSPDSEAGSRDGDAFAHPRAAQDEVLAAEEVAIQPSIAEAANPVAVADHPAHPGAGEQVARRPRRSFIGLLGLDRFSGLYVWAALIVIFAIWVPHTFLSVSNLQLVAGPAIGGALAGLAGLTAAFAVNAGSFFASALLLTRLGPLPPQPGTAQGGIITDARAGLRYAARSRLLRALVLGTLVFVSFAAADNVALVFLIRHSLHGSAAGYGVATAAFGAPGNRRGDGGVRRRGRSELRVQARGQGSGRGRGRARGDARVPAGHPGP